MANWIVVTGLEGALLNEMDEGSEADNGPLKRAIAQLEAKEVPVIVFTDSDRAEVEPIRERLGLVSPFITESGSGIFTPVNQNPFKVPLGEREDEYYVEALGCPYVQARAGLRVMANLMAHPLKGFGDFTVPQLEKAMKLSEAAAHRAKDREFSEPFMTPKAVDAAVLRQTAEEMGFGLLLRSPDEGRFSVLVGPEAGLGLAVQRVIAAYQQQMAGSEPLKVLGLSAQMDDLEELAAACGSAEWTGLAVAGPSDWRAAVAPLWA